MGRRAGIDIPTEACKLQWLPVVLQFIQLRVPQGKFPHCSPFENINYNFGYFGQYFAILKCLHTDQITPVFF